MRNWYSDVCLGEFDSERFNEDKSESNVDGIKCVIGGFLIHLFLGWVYLWGNISIYVSSYFYFHQGITKVNVAFSVMIAAQGVCTIFGPFLLKRLGPTYWLCVGSSISLIGTFIASFMTNFYLYCIFYSAWFGIGVGCCYLVPVTCAWQYFPNYKGLVTGIIVGGFGFGSFIFSFLSTAIINPNNEKPDLRIDGGRIFTQQHIIDKTPYMLRFLVLVWTIIVFISLFLIKGNPHKWEGAAKESHKNELKLRLLEKSSEINLDDSSCKYKIIEFLRERPNYAVLSFWEALLSTNTLLLWLMICFSASYGMFMAHVYKYFGVIHINDDFFLTMVGSFGAVMNGGSRSIWSTFQDKYSFKRIFGILLIIQITLSGSLVSIASIGEGNSLGKPLYMIWICASFFCLGGHFSMFPTVTSRLYGVVTGSEVYGILFTSFSFATIGGRVLSDLLLDTYGYNIIFYILWGFSILSGILLCIFDMDKTNQLKAEKIMKSHSVELSNRL